MGNEKKIPKDFSVSISLPQSTHNPNITKARARIFYKGPNRNGSFITSEFAQKLMNTINYIPIKGIYHDENFLGHGDSKTMGKAYGVVPKEHNFAWEVHLDNDGIEREYAAVDVYLWDFYKETKEIIDSPQSMELDEASINGEWVVIEGQQYFKFTDASFIGLQVLGKEIEPCFEGSSFFSKNSDIVDFIKNVVAVEMAMYDLGGNVVKDEKNKPEATEVDEVVVEEREEEDPIEVEVEEEEVVEEEVVEEEVAQEEGEEVSVEVETEEKNPEEFEKLPEETQKNEEGTSFESTLETEVRELRAENEKLKATLHELKEYQNAAEREKKEAVLVKYADLLSEEVVSNYRDKTDDYTVSELEKELAYELVKTRTDVFSSNVQVVPHEESHGHESGIEAILNKYKNKERK